MKEILDSVLSRIRPSREEEKAVREKIDKVVHKVDKAVAPAKAVLGGSGEKGTWLKDAHDADIFVKFPYAQYKDRSDSLSDILETKLKGIYKVERLHGSRDYFQTEQEGFTFEIVPIIEVAKAEDALNITDVSPLHADWVKKHSKYADEIRLTKQFFKAAKVYGAESYINGFSGYICEILTIHYGGFIKLCKAISKWSEKVIIDPEKHYKNRNDILFSVDKAKTQGPIVIVDPVQRSRNAAAAVSDDKFFSIIDYARKFLKSPKEEHFIEKKIAKKEIAKKAGKDDFFSFRIKPKSGKEDVVGCKIVKVFEHMQREISEGGFSVLYSAWEWDKEAVLFFIIRKEELGIEKIVEGPPVRIRKGSVDFRRKHKDVFEKDGRLYAKEKRRYRKPSELIRSFLSDEYILERVEKIKLE